MARTDYESVDDYIAAQPVPARFVLERVRATIRKALPGATEGISYQIPVYKLDGVMVLYFAGFQRHYSIYPATARVVSALENELTGLLHSKATIRFPLADAVPTRLITRIAKLRAAEVTRGFWAGSIPLNPVRLGKTLPKPCPSWRDPRASDVLAEVASSL